MLTYITFNYPRASTEWLFYFQLEIELLLFYSLLLGASVVVWFAVSNPAETVDF
jgi:hypothetical protein